MSVPASRFPIRNFVIAVVVGMALLGAAVVAGVNFAVDRAVSADARGRAEDWARYFVGSLPNLDGLLQGATLDDADHAAVTAAAKVGNVFRFKLYNAKGQTIVQSDSADDDAVTDDDDGDAEHLDNEIADVVESHEPEVSLNDGTHERGMPPLYAEAYVPVLSAGGDLRAVVETYLDETRTATLFKTSFAVLAAVLGLGTALAFGIPTLAFLMRTKQARDVAHQAKFLESHDPLTSLLNRSAFASALATRITGRTPGECLAVAFLDLDELKTVNAGFGNEGGDALLKHAAAAIARFCGERDFLSRAGGDEFMVALGRPSAAEVTEAVEAMMAAIREPFSIGGRRLSGRVSGGLYLVTGTESVEEALHRSDVALYEAKVNGGKNVLRTFSPEAETSMRGRRDLEQLLRDALTYSLFDLHYQPLLDAGSKRCLGFEALLRLNDRNGIPVSPATFIPVAEQLGLIDQIGEWVLNEAIGTAAAWPAPMFISINLSVRQFQSGDLVAKVERALFAAGLSAERLELEVTETLLMENTESVARQLAELKALGVSIAMDDFGTGYSSLSYLWQFGFDKLKIDRSFVTALDRDEKKAREVLDTVVMLAHKLDMKVTAEGIETERQARVLQSLACDQFQGFLFGKPRPVDSIPRQFLTDAGPSRAVPAA